MTRDDPFGLDDAAGRTRIRPAPHARSEPRTPPRGEGPASRIRRESDNPFVQVFSIPLGLAPELERATPPENPENLRARLFDTLIETRDAAVSRGLPLARADQGAWFVAALLDDVALNTPWGGHSTWPRQPLVASLYGDVDAGERFYDRLEELIRHPDRDRDLLELAFLCLSLGFRGMHRVTGAAGEGAVAQIRAQIARLQRRRDRDAAPLSPHWQGVATPDVPRRFAVPPWSLALIAVALLTAIYAGLSMRLSERGEQLYALAQILPPPERAGIFRPERETVDTAELELAPTIIEFLPLVAAAAPSGLVPALSGREDVSLAVIAMQGSDPEVFPSARADINPIYDPLVEAIAKVVVDNVEFVGGLKVVGHTDSIPVQRSNPFASNQGLSEARARTVADALVAAGVPAELVTSDGRAAQEPIASNATSEGRARNRRVEILIEKKI